MWWAIYFIDTYTSNVLIGKTMRPRMYKTIGMSHLEFIFFFDTHDGFYYISQVVTWHHLDLEVFVMHVKVN